MSIINDALKKVQNDLAQKSLGTSPESPDKKPLTERHPAANQTPSGPAGLSPTPRPPHLPPADRSGRKQRPLTQAPAIPAVQKSAPPAPVPKTNQRFLLFLAFTVLLLSSLALRHDIRSGGRALLSAPPKTAPVKTIEPVAVLPVAQPETTPPPTAPVPMPKKDPVVSGIMTMNNRQVALIDNDMYEVGQTLAGMRIVDITFDQVVVEENGQTRSLWFRHKP